TDVTSLTPTIVHTGASIIPENGVAQDFTNPVIYTVTAEDGTTRSYTVTVTSTLNPAKSITGFSFTDPAVTGDINEAARTISITVPYGTDVSSLTPTIVHTGASITPGSGITQDFTNPVIYTVTAEDGTTRSYTVTVTSTLNPGKSITGFSFTDPAVTGDINEAARTVSITVPYGTDVTSLTPTIVHTGASISPDSGVDKDFSNPVTYTVTAADSTIQHYTVTVNVAPNTAKEITSFKFTDPAVDGVINETAKTVNMTVPYGTNVTALVPTIAHTGETISPNTGVAQNFTNPITYILTAIDATTQEYVVTVRVSGSSTATTSTSTTNGGGGGGGATGEEFENIEFKDVSSIFVGRDMSVRFEFRNDDSDIRYIAYDSLKNAGTISATIEVLKGRSSFADTLPEGIVYRNINIWVGKTGYAIPENIEGPVIGFRVPGSWIDANDIDVDSIVVNRYDGRWSRLPTLQTGSDDSYLYFEASTPGFSPFAITGESLDENIRLESAPDILNSPVDEIEPQINTSILDNTTPDKTLNSISGLACILILFITCFLRRKH
ncbi:MAG: PGF-pre-PGF domain-containing protein, partial [Methanolobus sp.]|nr:PGF-pre-PGF domain-containing protein [Methanolobus sp.]